MKAILYDHYGSPDVLHYEELEKPLPADDQILIQVRASSVNPYDWHFIRGTPSFIRLFIGMRAPKSRRLGADVAGLVEAVGRNVTSFKVGDSVFGTAVGSFAEYVCAPESTLALKPENLTWEQAASAPIAGITALQGLRDTGRILKGSMSLSTAQPGAWGHSPYRLPNRSEPTSLRCVAPETSSLSGPSARTMPSTTRVKTSFMAPSATMYFLIWWATTPCPHACVCCSPRVFTSDAVAEAPTGGPWNPLAPCSTASCFALHNTKAPGFLAKVNTADLNVLADLMRSGKVTPVLDSTYALKETAEAIRYIEHCHARGKVTITVP